MSKTKLFDKIFNDQISYFKTFDESKWRAMSNLTIIPILNNKLNKKIIHKDIYSINKHLNMSYESTNLDKKQILKITSIIDTIFKDVPHLKYDIVVYRGMCVKNIDLFKDHKKNDIFVNKSYTATSLSKDISLRYFNSCGYYWYNDEINDNDYTYKTLFTISIKENSKILLLNDRLSEIVLNRNSKFKINNIKRTKFKNVCKTYIYCELINT